MSFGLAALVSSVISLQMIKNKILYKRPFANTVYHLDFNAIPTKSFQFKFLRNDNIIFMVYKPAISVIRCIKHWIITWSCCDSNTLVLTK